MKRFAFHDRVKVAFAMVVMGETRKYAILQFPVSLNREAVDLYDA